MMRTSQQEGQIVVCQLENAHWVLHQILIEAKNNTALIKHAWHS